MGKISKNKRIGVITQMLTQNPGVIFSLNYFSELFNCAKSTLSEDIDILESFYKEYNLGEIISIAGAAGGIIYQPRITNEKIQAFAGSLCTKIKESSRIIPGGYIYLNDIFYDPSIVYDIGRILANPFYDKNIDYIVTIETKGIPLAFMTAKILNKPVVVVRKSARLTEGTNIQMNYITGSSKTIKTMSLTKRAIQKKSNVLFIDDFMKAGGTAKGIIDLMEEFEAKVVGIGVVLTTKQPENKLIKDYYSLLELVDVDEKLQKINIKPYDNGF